MKVNPTRNCHVAECWAQGKPARNHRNTFHTDGVKIYSYCLQIGDTTSDGEKIVKDYTARGTYGFESQTTSCHVGLIRNLPEDYEVIVV